jgi:hypothetical protein
MITNATSQIVGSDEYLDAQYAKHQKRGVLLMTAGLTSAWLVLITLIGNVFVRPGLLEIEIVKTLPVVSIACLMHGLIANIRCYQIRHGDLPCGPYQFVGTHFVAWFPPPDRNAKRRI